MPADAKPWCHTHHGSRSCLCKLLGCLHCALELASLVAVNVPPAPWSVFVLTLLHATVHTSGSYCHGTFLILSGDLSCWGFHLYTVDVQCLQCCISESCQLKSVCKGVTLKGLGTDTCSDTALMDVTVQWCLTCALSSADGPYNRWIKQWLENNNNLLSSHTEEPASKLWERKCKLMSSSGSFPFFANGCTGILGLHRAG